MNRSDEKFYSANSFVAGLVFSLFVVVVWQFFKCGPDWLYRWQTMITGLSASAAGLLAFFGLKQQMALQLHLEQDKRHRQNLVDRARLSQPLSDLIGVQRQVLDRLTAPFDKGAYLVKPDSLLPIVFSQFPRSNSSDLAQITRCIKSSEVDVADEISQLIADIQIQNARLHDRSGFGTIHSEGGETPYKIYAFIAHAVKIYARAQRLLYYARKEDDEYSKFTLLNSARNAIQLARLDAVNSELTKYLSEKLETKYWGT